MFKPLALTVKGKITAPASQYAVTLQIDAALFTVIDTALGAGDWTYLAIEVAQQLEIVKVTGTPTTNNITVIRGQEYTDKKAVSSGTKVTYLQTLSSIIDTFTQQIDPFVLTGTGIVTIQGNNVHITEPTIVAYGDTDVLGKFKLVSGGLIEGCGPVHCGVYILAPFYLTSKNYPIEYVEKWKSTAEWISGREYGLQIDDWASQASWVSGTLQLILSIYDIPPDHWQSTGLWVSGDMVTILLTYDSPPDHWQSTGLWVSGDMVTILIVYSNWPLIPDEWQSEASWISGTLI